MTRGWRIDRPIHTPGGDKPFRAVARYVRPLGEPGPTYILFGDGATAGEAREAVLAACLADRDWRGVMG